MRQNSKSSRIFRPPVGHIHGTPIYWNSPNNGPLIYVWGEQDYLKAFKLVNGTLSDDPHSQRSVHEGSVRHARGAILSVSCQRKYCRTGIVWASHPYNADANTVTVAGILGLLMLPIVSNELWNSKQNTARDDLGNFAKFCPPTVANGKVYLATFSNQLVVYGLLGGTPPPMDTQAPSVPTSLRVTTTSSTSVTLGWMASTDNVGVMAYQIFRGTTLVGDLRHRELYRLRIDSLR